MKYLVTVLAMVCSLVYLGWLFTIEVSNKIDQIEKTSVCVSVCVWLVLFLYLAIFQMDKGGEEIQDEN